ncbi:hypothetical protein ACC675_37395, partial [Rhizobium ruizarguesonis]
MHVNHSGRMFRYASYPHIAPKEVGGLWTLVTAKRCGVVFSFFASALLEFVVQNVSEEHLQRN